MPSLPGPTKAGVKVAAKTAGKKSGKRKGGKKGAAKAAASTAGVVAVATKSAAKASKSVRTRLKAASSTAMVTIKKMAPAAEIVGGAAFASWLAAWRKAKGQQMKIGGIDGRIIGGLGMHLVAMLAFPKHAAAEHVMNLGTGVLGSFLIDAAAEMGTKYGGQSAAAAAAPTTTSNGITVLGSIDESGAVKTKDERKAFRAEKRDDRRTQRVQKKLGRIDQKRNKIEDRGGSQSTASKADRRPVLVVPEDGAYNMQEGRYVKVGALANF
jgi:hypothetical protein